MQQFLGLDPLLAAYVAAFGVAALACFGGLTRLGALDHADTERGLRWLLRLSGTWAAFHVAFLVVPATNLKLLAYYAGLTVGFATVGAWLYFCSAYTGRNLHRVPGYRRLAVAVFLVVIAVKYTNPLHGLYFTATVASTPFPHLAVEHQLFHWLAMGLSYLLAGIGYFMLLELFAQSGDNTRPLAVLVGLTGLPVVLDIAGRQLPVLIDMTYEPLGVAAFAVGVLFLFYDRFRAIRLVGTPTEPAVFLTAADRIRDANEEATSAFPELEGATGQPFVDVLPDVAAALGADTDANVVELDRNGDTQFYRVSTTPLSFGTSTAGRVVVLTDVTQAEQYRQEVERQNERLGQFASVVSHDLRNPLNVAIGRTQLERETRDSEHLEAAATALVRMQRLIDDVLTLAREGEDIGEQESVSLAVQARQAWESIDAPDATLEVEADGQLRADASRLQQLLENLFRNSVLHGTGDASGPDNETDAVTVRVGWLDGDSGFYVEDDGRGIPVADRDQVFEFGHSSDPEGSGLGLAIVQTIAEAHGWRVDVTESGTGGARFELRGVTLVRMESP
ncbi:sensor histidine kinase [Halorarius litoreus]|uniref:sensor histidine kinase n=1 Tax=Halorarius litoreus TaxID=2962676 RepID=UPI0020CC13CD|nr:ATP-binding protein [Halorarius litoreus]